MNRKKLVAVLGSVAVAIILSVFVMSMKIHKTAQDADYNMYGNSINSKVRESVIRSFNSYFSKKYDDAVQQMQIAVNIEPSNSALNYHLGRLKLKTNDRDSGIDILKKVANGSDKFSDMAKDLLAKGDSPTVPF